MAELIIGKSHEVSALVTESKTAVSVGSGSLQVLATPVMCGLMEQAASELTDSMLEPENTSVGISLNIQHVAATPVGMKIKASAELVAVDGRKLSFKLQAFDEAGEIGHGEHERFIVNRDKFQSKADSKK